jgi:S1-C subfamily serine protease
MPDPGPGFSRLCPACGRRVPRSVAVCRCGAEVPALADVPPPSQDESRRGLTLLNLAAGLLLLAAVAATGYWSFAQPPATIRTSTAPKGGVADGGLLAPPSTTTRVPLSAERQAGEAEARQPEPAAAPVPSPTAPVALEEVVDRVMPAVVLVETSSGRGSAFYVRPDTLITNVHVVKEDGFVKLRRMDGSTTSARVELRAPAFDIAILRVSAPAADQVVIPLGTARTLRAGQEVFTIGSPFGTLRNSVTRGIVSGLRVSGAATMVQNDAAANPGNSGGPLLDRNGLAIGVTTASATDKPGISYAVAIDHARSILDGGLADSTAPPLALNNVRAQDPPGRPADEGERAFLAAAAELGRAADGMDAGWQQFRQSCYKAAVAGEYSREWFVMLTPRAISPAQVGGSCATFLVAFQKEAARISAEMRAALEKARRAGVLPGVVRDTLRTHRLEFDGWDR